MNVSDRAVKQAEESLKLNNLHKKYLIKQREDKIAANKRLSAEKRRNDYEIELINKMIMNVDQHELF